MTDADTYTEATFRPITISLASHALAAHYFAEAARIARVLAPLLDGCTGAEAAEIVAGHIEARAERVL